MIRTTSTPSKLEQQKALLGGAVPVKAPKPKSKAQAKPEKSVNAHTSSALAVLPNTAEALPALIDRATKALAGARDSAEVLEARDMARIAYDAAKSAGRLARAKEAHDTVLAQVYRAQADALLIEARAKMRLAEEYDAAQDAGEVGQRTGRPSKNVPEQNDFRPASAADVGLSRKEIHEARQVRDAEAADPGVVSRTLNTLVERGEEPTKAKLNREIAKPKPAPKKIMDQKALWLWGRLNDFERDGILASDPTFLVSEMTEPMRADVKRLVPLVRAFLEQLESAA